MSHLDPRHVAHALGGEAHGNNISAPGPKHSPEDRSLSVKLDPNAPDGFIIYSHAGDDINDCRDHVRTRLELPPWKPNGKANGHAHSSAAKRASPKRFSDFPLTSRGYIHTNTYSYIEGGVELYQVLRYEHPTEEKEFLQRRPDGAGGWLGNAGSRKVLYRLEALKSRAHGTVLICEGEKDADRLAFLRFLATTVASGAWKDVDVSALAGCDCLVLEDNDEAGVKKALKAAEKLHGTARTIRIVRLPGLPDGGDVSDWLDADPNRSERLVATCFDAPEWGPAAETEEEGPEKPAGLEDRVALDFAELFAARFRFVAMWNRWMKYDGTRWLAEDTLYAFDEARKLCREAGDAKAKTVAAVVTLARTDRRLAATTDQWDADNWQSGTPEGTIDLRTGNMRPNLPDDYLTKITTVAPRGNCPLWRQFLDRVTGGDNKLLTYLQRVAGYALTGDTSEDALFFLYGTGANGKSVFVKTIAGILGDHHKTASMETFTVSNNDRHPTDLADLRGARLVTAVETEEGKRWDEVKIKALTGGDRIKARFMRQDFFEYTPRFKLMIAGNHRPGIRSVDEAIRRRMNLIPFTVTIPRSERDPELADKLRTEWPAILAWMVEGCLAWQREGLCPPEAVTAATDDYLEAEDALHIWIDECCEAGPNLTDSSGNLWVGWKAWAEKVGEYIGSKRKFSQKLEDKGFSRERGTKGRRRYAGIRFVGNGLG